MANLDLNDAHAIEASARCDFKLRTKLSPADSPILVKLEVVRNVP